MLVHAHGACDVKYDIRMKESCKTDCRFEFLVEFCVYSDIGHVTSVTSVTFVTSVLTSVTSVTSETSETSETSGICFLDRFLTRNPNLQSDLAHSFILIAY